VVEVEAEVEGEVGDVVIKATYVAERFYMHNTDKQRTTKQRLTLFRVSEARPEPSSLFFPL